MLLILFLFSLTKVTGALNSVVLSLKKVTGALYSKVKQHIKVKEDIKRKKKTLI